MSLLPVLVNFDRSQLAAAESLGATRAQAFRHVLLPQIAAPVAGAAMLVAAVVFGAYGTALALVGTQLSHPAACSSTASSPRPGPTFPPPRRWRCSSPPPARR